MSSVAARFNKPVHKLAVPHAGLALPYAKVGVEMEVEHYTISHAAQLKLLPNWEPHPDEHSIRNKGMELVTRGGLVGEDLVREIKLFCEVALEKKWSEGYPRAGLHLHVDVTDMNDTSATQMLHMMMAYMLFEDAMFAFAGEWRKTCGFCDGWMQSQNDWPWLAKMLVSWDQFEPGYLSPQYFSKYQALNLLPIARQGTIEFRHMPMTFDSVRILNWLNLCLSFKRFGMEQDLDPAALLAKEGPDALVKAVFGEYAHIIQPFVNEAELYNSLPEVMYLKLLREQQPLDPWHGPDNPLLASKKLEVVPVRLHAAQRAVRPRRPGAAALRGQPLIAQELIGRVVAHLDEAPVAMPLDEEQL